MAMDRNLRISLWGRFGVEIGVVRGGLGGGELVEGAMELQFLVNVHWLLLIVLIVLKV